MRDLSDCVGRIDLGRKAEILARALAAGLRVAPGLVIEPSDRLDDSEALAGLNRRLLAIGAQRWVVRSSSSVEDAARRAAAGLFCSVVDVATAEVVDAAIKVRESVHAEGVRAYLTSHHIDPSSVRMTVLVQPLVAAELMGVARSRPKRIVVEERKFGEPEWADVAVRQISVDDPGALAGGVRQLGQIVGGEVDVEFARSGEQVWFLQARPSAEAGALEPDAAFLGHVGKWRLDMEHNPEPLSLAQAGLIERLAAAGISDARIFGGYLFYPTDRTAADSWDANLRQQYQEEIAPDCFGRLADAAKVGDVPSALSAYEHVMRRYQREVTPQIRAARLALDDFLERELGERLAQHGDLLAGLGGLTLERDQLLYQLGHDESLFAAYCLRFGAYCPGWDVAIATDEESRERVLAIANHLRNGASPEQQNRQAAERADAAHIKLRDRMFRRVQSEFSSLLSRVRQVSIVAEDDDALFFAAQRSVRRALLERGRQWLSQGQLAAVDDVFFLPLDVGSSDARAAATLGRAVSKAQRRMVAPLRLVDGIPIFSRPGSAEVLHGLGTSGKVRGKASVVRSFEAAPAALPADRILVITAMLPSLSYLLAGARGLITAHGGVLSHGATLAREYGVPAVLAVSGATEIADDAELYLDADTGSVYVLG